MNATWWCLNTIQFGLLHLALMRTFLLDIHGFWSEPLLEILTLCARPKHANRYYTSEYTRLEMCNVLVLPLGGDAPKLTHVNLSGVHIDWSWLWFLSGLTVPELSEHRGRHSRRWCRCHGKLNLQSLVSELGLDWCHQCLPSCGSRGLTLTVCRDPSITAIRLSHRV